MNSRDKWNRLFLKVAVMSIPLPCLALPRRVSSRNRNVRFATIVLLSTIQQSRCKEMRNTLLHPDPRLPPPDNTEVQAAGIEEVMIYTVARRAVILLKCQC